MCLFAEICSLSYAGFNQIQVQRVGRQSSQQNAPLAVTLFCLHAYFNMNSENTQVKYAQLAKKLAVCYIINRKDNRPQGGLPAKKQKSCPYRSKYWGSFSMCILLTVLKHERQQCQYKHTENHKILECKIYHRHHLHSLRMKATPPCTTVVKIILSHKHIFSNTL